MNPFYDKSSFYYEDYVEYMDWLNRCIFGIEDYEEK